jgi:hypothetical protein
MRVQIKEHGDGTLDVIYNAPNKLEAKVLNVPKVDFLQACADLADEIATTAACGG